jgi:hypothetical protein
MARRFLRENSLSLTFFVLFLLAFFGQSISGWKSFNHEQLEHGASPVSWGGYVVSPAFGSAVLENWQSEYLQFALFILATIWLFQKGSNESKRFEDLGRESEQQQKLGAHAPAAAPGWARARGWRRAIYSNSLLLVMGAIFLASWAGQSLSSWREFNDEQLQHGSQTITWARFLAEPTFWEQTLQNWQSEFLAVGTIVVFSIYLRQRGSPESKPVGSPHNETAASG